MLVLFCEWVARPQCNAFVEEELINSLVLSLCFVYLFKGFCDQENLLLLSFARSPWTCVLLYPCGEMTLHLLWL